MVGRRRLGQLPAWRLGREPAQEPGQRGGVPTVRCPSTLLLHGVLARPRQSARVLACHNARSRRPQGMGEPGGRGVRVDTHALPAHSRQRRWQRIRRFNAYALTQVLAQRGRQLGGVDKQPHRSVCPQHGVRQCQRRVRQVTAANVQQPGDAVRVGQHGRVLARLAQQSRRRRALAGRIHARKLGRVRHRRGCRRRWPVGPGGIQRVDRQWHEHGSRSLQPGDRRFRVQSGVVANTSARRVLAEAIPRAGLPSGAAAPTLLGRSALRLAWCNAHP